MRTKFCSEPFFFRHPEPDVKKYCIYPIFFPFSGCPQRCLFCAQEVQTGHAIASVESILCVAAQRLEERLAASLPPVELAFFGGTFTAMPRDDFFSCLRFALHWQERGAVTSARCSTRPDALTPALLADLRSAGFTLVELGIQSFSSSALAAAKRGYTEEAARKGCALVQESGLSLGIQLMPGMPGVSEEQALEDVEQAISFAPACARLYPCLVLEGAGLAPVWRAGDYAPWDESLAVSFLAQACLRFWKAGIPVIRMGVAQEPGLLPHVLAGPYHPALGSSARGLALALHIKEQLAAARLSDTSQCFRHQEGQESSELSRKVSADSGSGLMLYAPRRYQGEFWGHRGALVPFYEAMGLPRGNIVWCDEDRFAIVQHGDAC